ncbi:MAG: ATP cone domain-containing protein [Clostridium sp.]|nr:ATP cone domain-containing protein [Clostridium sp.]MDY3827400.1 ATP cone domain-containing protein [Clostridium sp.]
MKIIKKDGRIQDFDERKIQTSINNASKDLDEMALNESDIKVIASDVVNTLKKIRKDDNTSSYEVIGVITDVLVKDGFDILLKSFINFN